MSLYNNIVLRQQYEIGAERSGAEREALGA